MSRIVHGHPRHGDRPETCPNHKSIDGTQVCSYGDMHYTDHTAEVAHLRLRAAIYRKTITGDLTNLEKTIVFAMETAADLLEIHDDTGLSLDNWEAARGLVEHLLGEPILPNCV